MAEVSNYLKSEQWQRQHPAKRIIVLRQTICTDQFGMCPIAGIFTEKHIQTWQKEEQPINHSTGHKDRIPKGCELYTNDLTWPGHSGVAWRKHIFRSRDDAKVQDKLPASVHKTYIWQSGNSAISLFNESI